MLEVEVKIPLEGPGRRPEDVVARLEAAGARSTGERRQEDTYFRHPGRDLAATDEALRLRVEGEAAEGEAAEGQAVEAEAMELTYKGPRHDAAAKVREEHNVAVAADPTALLRSLGFTPAAQVRKTRRTWEFQGATVCLDQVDDLGTFLEIEIMDGDVDRIRAIAASLGLDPDDAEPRSYLELLLQDRPVESDQV